MIWGLVSGVGFGVSEGVTQSHDFYNGVQGVQIHLIRFIRCVALHAIWTAATGINIFGRQHFFRGQLHVLEWRMRIAIAIIVPMIGSSPSRPGGKQSEAGETFPGIIMANAPLALEHDQRFKGDLMLKRCLVCLILLLAVWSGEAWYYLSDRPFQGSHDAIAALNGGDAEANRLRVNEAAKNIPTLIGAGLSVLVVVGCFIDLYWYAEVPRLRREGHENEKHS